MADDNFSDWVTSDAFNDWLTGEDLHRELSRALGMPAWAADMGYHAIANGFVPEGIDISNFVHVGQS